MAYGCTEFKILMLSIMVNDRSALYQLQHKIQTPRLQVNICDGMLSKRLLKRVNSFFGTISYGKKKLLLYLTDFKTRRFWQQTVIGNGIVLCICIKKQWLLQSFMLSVLNYLSLMFNLDLAHLTNFGQPWYLQLSSCLYHIF